MFLLRVLEGIAFLGAALLRGLQQRVALLEDAVVVGAHAGQPGSAGHEQVVEEAAPLRRVALDHGEILRREQDGAQQAEHLARASGRVSG